MKILIVEDDDEISSLIEYYFTKDGYDVVSTSDGLEGLKLLKTTTFNLVILDVMLPNLDGINFTKIVRSMSEEYGTPEIIMLTAKTEIEDVICGLEIGADDYIKKPFDPRELLIRAKKLLNKKDRNLKKYKMFENIKIDEDKHSVSYSGAEVELSKKEYDLLLLLIKKQGVVINRHEILKEVWNSNYYLGDRTVDVYISKLREKIPILIECIKTVKGVGYRLEERG